MPLTDPLCRSFLDLWWHFDPAAASRAGLTDHDARLGAYDPDSVRQQVAALRSIAGAVEDLEIEDTGDEIDRTALLDHLRVLLFRFEREHPYQKNPALWLEHLTRALLSLLAREGDLPDLAAAVLGRLRATPRFLSDARDSLRRPAPVLVDAAAAQIAACTQLLDDVAERFDAEWTADDTDAAAALTEARAALEQFGTALRALPLDPDPHAGAVGEEEVDRRLHYEHASIHNSGEVRRAAMRLAAETEAELTALAASIEPNRSWRELYEQARGEPPVWSELVTRFHDALAGNARLLESRGLNWETPPLTLQQLAPVEAVLEPIASYRAGGLAASAAVLVADPDAAALPWLAARLGLPGAHLHRAQRDALPGQVRRHIAATSTPLGWSLYAGELMAELGLGSDPEARLAERVLFLRDVYLALVDLGFHSRQLTADEAVAQLTERLPFEPAVALADVRRIACRPTSACAAILGVQELRRLRQDAAEARGSEFSLDGFHREVLSYGGLPVPLIRWGMGLDA